MEVLVPDEKVVPDEKDPLVREEQGFVASSLSVV